MDEFVTFSENLLNFMNKEGQKYDAFFNSDVLD